MPAKLRQYYRPSPKKRNKMAAVKLRTWYGRTDLVCCMHLLFILDKICCVKILNQKIYKFRCRLHSAQPTVSCAKCCCLNLRLSSSHASLARDNRASNSLDCLHRQTRCARSITRSLSRSRFLQIAATRRRCHGGSSSQQRFTD